MTALCHASLQVNFRDSKDPRNRNWQLERPRRATSGVNLWRIVSQQMCGCVNYSALVLDLALCCSEQGNVIFWFADCSHADTHDDNGMSEAYSLWKLQTAALHADNSIALALCVSMFESIEDMHMIRQPWFCKQGKIKAVLSCCEVIELLSKWTGVDFDLVSLCGS